MASQRNKKKKTDSRSLSKDQFVNEIIAVAALAFALALFLSNFNIIGSFGSRVNGIFFGIFGITAYLIPFIIVFCVFLFMANRTEPIVKKKVICCVIFALLLSGLIQIFKFDMNFKLKDFYEYSKNNKSYGGIVGGFITKMLCPYIGKVGAFIILTALLVILFVMITEKLVITRMIKNSLKAVDAAKAHHNRNEEYRKERRINSLTDDDPEYDRDKNNRIYSFSKEDMASEKLINDVKPVKKSRRKKKSDSAGVVDINNSLEATDPDTGEVYLKELNDKFGMHEKADSFDDNNWQQSFMNEEELIPAKDADLNDDFISSSSQALSASDPSNVSNNDHAYTNDNTEKEVSAKKSDSKEYEAIMDETSKELAKSVQETIKPQRSRYIFPPLNILSLPKGFGKGNSASEANSTAAKLKNTLESFGVNVTISDISVGPTVTRYELIPQQGIKVSKITNLSDDIKLSLAATDRKSVV